MSILEKLQDKMVKKCINCEYLYFYHDGCYHGDCVYITNCDVDDRCGFDCFEGVCDKFEYEKNVGKNRRILCEWQNECNEYWRREHEVK